MGKKAKTLQKCDIFTCKSNMIYKKIDILSFASLCTQILNLYEENQDEWEQKNVSKSNL
jgi:hypothetical protein